MMDKLIGNSIVKAIVSVVVVILVFYISYIILNKGM